MNNLNLITIIILILIYLFSAGIKVIQHSESVNYNKDKENELLTYFREGRALDHDVVMLNKSSYVPPTLAVLFFNGQASFKHVSLLLEQFNIHYF